MCRKPGVRENTAVVDVNFLHHFAPLREVRSHCRPTKLAVEFAQVLVEVIVPVLTALTPLASIFTWL